MNKDNPYQCGTLASALRTNGDVAHPAELIGIVVTTLAAGAILGGVFAAVNYAIYPIYTYSDRRLPFPVPAWLPVDGIVEGLSYGVLCALVFTSIVGYVSHGRCTYLQARPFHFALIGGSALCWLVGGIGGTGLEAFFPRFVPGPYRLLFHDDTDYLRFGWVIGSVWTVRRGTIALLIMVSTRFALSWRSHRAIRSNYRRPIDQVTIDH